MGADRWIGHWVVPVVDQKTFESQVRIANVEMAGLLEP